MYLYGLVQSIPDCLITTTIRSQQLIIKPGTGLTTPRSTLPVIPLGIISAYKPDVDLSMCSRFEHTSCILLFNIISKN